MTEEEKEHLVALMQLAGLNVEMHCFWTPCRGCGRTILVNPVELIQCECGEVISTPRVKH